MATEDERLPQTPPCSVQEAVRRQVIDGRGISLPPLSFVPCKHPVVWCGPKLCSPAALIDLLSERGERTKGAPASELEGYGLAISINYARNYVSSNSGAPNAGCSGERDE